MDYHRVDRYLYYRYYVRGIPTIWTVIIESDQPCWGWGCWRNTKSGVRIGISPTRPSAGVMSLWRWEWEWKWDWDAVLGYAVLFCAHECIEYIALDLIT